MSLERKRELRTMFVRWLYDTTDGHEQKPVDPANFMKEFALGEDELAGVITYLEGEGLVRADAYSLGSYLPGLVMIRHLGVREIEDAIDNPEQPTQHFAPLINVTNIHGNVTQSQIQQGSPGATQHGAYSFTDQHRGEVLHFTQAMRAALPDLALAGEVLQDVKADIEALEREARRSEPRPGVLREVSHSLRTVLEGTAAGAAGSGLVAAAIAAWPHLPF